MQFGDVTEFVIDRCTGRGDASEIFKKERNTFGKLSSF